MSSINERWLDYVSTEVTPFVGSKNSSLVNEFLGLHEDAVMGEGEISIGWFKKRHKETIYLMSENRKHLFRVIEAYKADGTVVGHIMIQWARSIENGKFISEDFDDVPFWNNLVKYGPNSKPLKLSKIFIKDLMSSKIAKGEGAKGIGTVLMYTALFFSVIQGCEGRLMLDAVGDSPGFYFKDCIGMSLIAGPEFEPGIKEILKSSNTRDLGTQPMYLPEDRIPGIFKLARAKVRFKDPEQNKALEAFEKTTQSNSQQTNQTTTTT